jgi:hypothetical protein
MLADELGDESNSVGVIGCEVVLMQHVIVSFVFPLEAIQD